MTRTPDPDVPQRVRKRRELRDATIIAGVAEATTIWGMALDTTYFAEKFGYEVDTVAKLFNRLEQEGRLICVGTAGNYGKKWRVKETP